MSYGRSKLYGEADVVHRGGIADASVLCKNHSVRNVREARAEIDTLRSINARLVREISLLKQASEQAQQLADRDGLTGLYNRRRMLELLQAELARAGEEQQPLGVLFIDLDGFKGVNDRLGHAAGDELLMTVAARLSSRARAGDFVCRYGGDEFVLILPQVADLAAALKVADTLRRRLAMPYRISGEDVNITAAIGLALFPDEGATASDLLQVADEAMYRAKASAAALPTAAPARRREDKAKRRLVW